MNPPPGAVVIEGLVKRFGGFTAVDGISLLVAKGEIFGFLGPNGAGKSTTIRMLCGILAPTAGTGKVAGFDIVEEADRIRGRIGYMSQKFSLYDDLTVIENIDFYGGVYGVPRQRMRERRGWILSMAGLSDRAGSLTRELSVGWKQRLALGCAVVHEPEVLFLDEPTSGVDPLSRRGFWDLIYEEAGKGVTVFVTTHYMDEAEHCDRLGMIYGGKMVALGSPAELKRSHAGGTILEIEADPLMTALAVLAADPSVGSASIFGAYLHVAVENGVAAGEIGALLTGRGVVVSRIAPVAPSLEDVFVTLVTRADRESRPDGAA